MRHSSRSSGLFIVSLVAGLAAVIAIGACSSEAVTPPGTSILNWDRSKSQRDNIKTAKPAGDPTVLAKTLEAAGTPDKPFALELDVETRSLDVTEDGKSARHTAPTKVTMKVVSNDFWKLGASCEGPHYQLPEGGTTAEAMLLNCTIKMKRRDQHDELISMQIYGDGNINALGTKVKMTDRP